MKFRCKPSHVDITSVKPIDKVPLKNFEDTFLLTFVVAKCLSELHALSLLREVLVAIPLFFLCLEKRYRGGNPSQFCYSA